MKRAALILSIFIFAFSCDNNSKGSKPETDAQPPKDTVNMPAKDTIKWEELVSGRECSVEKPANLFIISNTQLDSLWSAAFKGEERPDKPVVDFSKSSVVALFTGTVKSGGHSIAVTSVQMNNGVIEITGEHKIPGKSCMSTTAVEFPYYLALTDRPLKGTPSFSIKTKEYECE